MTMTGNKSVSAAFTLNSYNVSASVTGGHGSVSPASQPVTTEALPQLASLLPPAIILPAITDSGQAVTNARRSAFKSGKASFTSTYVISNVAADHNVAVIFATDTHTVTASAPLGHGSVSPGIQGVPQGATASITITPDTGYRSRRSPTTGSPYLLPTPM